MTAILTAAEMRALEQAAIASGEVTGLELMERAGRGVVEAILAEWPELAQGASRAVVLCGPGNNGGDGFVVARLLKERGWEVEVFLYGDPEKLPPDARSVYGRWISLGKTSRIISLSELSAQVASALLPIRSEYKSVILVDALFGIGLTRPLERFDAISTQVSRLLDAAGVEWRCIAVDVPSGLCADSGRLLVMPKEGYDDAVPLHSDLTVTFELPKNGHYLALGPFCSDKLRVVDLGLPDNTVTRLPTELLNEKGAYKARRAEKRTGHKYTHGHALLLSGGCGRGGAARLAARGALRIGAGLVTLAVPPAALQENAARLDAIMLRSVRDAEALTALLADPRLNALGVGPGFGTGDREAALLAALLDATGPERPTPAVPGEEPAPGQAPVNLGRHESEAPRKPRPVVLDADALTLLARDPELRARLHPACVLTPHEGEFARLFPAIAERLRAPATTGPAYSKVDAARDAARESGAVVLLKGPDTVIAEPPTQPGTSGRAAINAAVYDRAAPWLASAGSGDVLAGMITGLLARGLIPFDAACTAAWLHVEAARSFGPGLIAEDLPEELPKVFRSLGL